MPTALPPKSVPKRDDLRNYMRKLGRELISRGVVSRTATAAEVAKAIAGHFATEVRTDFLAIMAEDVAPHLIEVGTAAVARNIEAGAATLMRHLFGGRRL